MPASPSLKALTRKVLKFRDDRDWKQFHNAKDMALSLVLEAAEVLEHFQWKNQRQAKAHVAIHKTDLAYELADVLSWVLVMAHDFDIDLSDAIQSKLKLNDQKYPVHRARGRAVKYTKL